MSALPMSTLDVQKALTVAAAQNFHIDPPGALDGRWGPHTQASFDSWVANQPAQMITNSVLLVQPARGAQSVTIDAAAAGVLQSLAAIYGIQSNTSQQIPSAAQ